MTFIREYALSIITVVLFSVLLEIMMPSSNFKKYIKLVAGLLVMFVLIRPVVKLPALEQTLEVFNISTEAFVSQSKAVQQQIAKAQEEQIGSRFTKSLEQKIQDDIYTAFGTSCTVQVIFDGKTVQSLKIKAPERTGEIQLFVKNNYGLEAQVEQGGTLYAEG